MSISEGGLFMALLGGLVHFLRSTPEKEKMRFSRFVVVVATAAFSGLLVEELTSAIGLSSEYRSILSGVAGYSGGSFLDDVVKRLRDMFFSRLEKDEKAAPR